jgi:O-antigen ligase
MSDLLKANRSAIAVRRDGDADAAEGTTTTRFASEVVALVLLSWLPVPVTAVVGARAGWPAAVALGAAAWVAFRRSPLSVLLSALVVSSTLVASGLVTQASEYMPVTVIGIPLLAVWSAGLAQRRALPALPEWPVVLALGAYLAWGLAAGAASTDRRLSAIYVAGMLVVAVVAFLVAPTALAGETDRRRFLGVVATLGVVVAGSSFLLWAIGPGLAFGLPFGDYLPSQLTLRGSSTGILVPRVAGMFRAPASESVVLVAALAVLLVMRSRTPGRRRLLEAAAVVAVTVALLGTQARTGWLMGAAAAGCAAAVALWLRRAVDLWSVGVAAVLLMMSALMLTNTVGAAVASGVAAEHEHLAVTDDASVLLTTRGGADLSGRASLWAASQAAIRERPLLGWGPGTDAFVISPRLNGAFSIYRGLSSHSTWYRTAVEMGVPGLAALVAVLLAAAVVAGLRALRAGGGIDLAMAAIAVTAIALTVGQFTETALFGGIAFNSFSWTLLIGLSACLGWRKAAPGLPAA